MQAEIVSRKENPLLKRVEIEFKVVHHGEGTPERNAIKEEIAKLAKAPAERVIIDNVDSQFGKPHSIGYAKIYDSKEDALAFERKHILARNELIKLEKKKKVKKVEAAPTPEPKEEAEPEEPEPGPEKQEEAPEVEEKGE